MGQADARIKPKKPGYYCNNYNCGHPIATHKKNPNYKLEVVVYEIC